jgi:hypothetical protein
VEAWRDKRRPPGKAPAKVSAARNSSSPERSSSHSGAKGEGHESRNKGLQASSSSKGQTSRKAGAQNQGPATRGDRQVAHLCDRQPGCRKDVGCRRHNAQRIVDGNFPDHNGPTTRLISRIPCYCEAFTTAKQARSRSTACRAVATRRRGGQLSGTTTVPVNLVGTGREARTENRRIP